MQAFFTALLRFAVVDECVVDGAVNDLRAHERMRMSSELREIFSDYTREYIRLRKETNRLLREGKIDKLEANHRNSNAKQFLMFARYQLEAAKKTSNLKPASSPHNWKLESQDNRHAKER